ncbi:MAG: hypothetical protein D3906_13580 [Candidatus Electrothrix sp. AUS1_2]|nr:hypothetical protein [Candidatus Electrothrix sp. AUS1_2]
MAVMGCIVNGPGESKDENIGLSLPGIGEDPVSPVYADGKRVAMLSEYDMIGGTWSSERKKPKKKKEEDE